MSKNLSFLGIDIGGAHIKLVGLDEKQNVIIVKYRKCYIWKNPQKLLREIEFINSLSNNKKVLCGITMTAELCDIFSTRNSGAKTIRNKCRKIKFKKLLYEKSKKVFESIDRSNPINFMSMNWHATGRFIAKFLENAILIDFGSTTTDFVCIKKKKIMNVGFDDFSRIQNGELLYTGIIRTPIFGIKSSVNLNSKEFHIIPEFFSRTSDIYRVQGKIKKKFDIDEEADLSNKSVNSSYRRIARSFGLDFSNENKKLIHKLSEKVSKQQLSLISKNLDKLTKKFRMSKDTPLILAGIGQEVLKDFFKNKNTKLFQKFIKSKNISIKTEATYHAPALSIACLLNENID